jgi:hypothetical protein
MAGRPKGSPNKAKLVATEIAHAALSACNQIELWGKLLKSKDERISLDALKYLSDRAYGKAAQPVGGAVTVNFTWGSKPEWMP